MNNRLKAIIKYKTDGKQKDFAAIMGWTPPYLAKLLAGGGNFGIQPVLAVLKTFPEINARWFLLGEGDMFTSDKYGNLRQQSLSHIKDVLDLERFLPVMTPDELTEYEKMVTSNNSPGFGYDTRLRWMELAAERQMCVNMKVNEAMRKSDELCRQ